MTAVRIMQRTDSNHGAWMIRCYNEKQVYLMIDWSGKDILVQLNENVGKKIYNCFSSRKNNSRCWYSSADLQFQRSLFLNK